MILTLILSALAGAFYHKIKPQVAEALARFLPEGETLTGELAEVAAFAAALLAVAIVLVLSGGSGNAVLILVGGLIGTFHRPIKALILTRMD